MKPLSQDTRTVPERASASRSSISVDRAILADPNSAIEREWLVTNGIGGFACGTLAGINTRRYHGLLVAALRPPVERIVMVAKLDAVVTYRGERYALYSNEFADGTIAPHGYTALASFRLDGAVPVWRWAIADAIVESRIWMPHGANTTYVQFEIVRASAPVEIEAVPLCTYRDYHAHHRGARETLVTRIERGVRIDAYWGATPYRLLSDSGSLEVAPEWYWSFRHRAETARALDDVEDLFRPCFFRAQLEAGRRWAIVLTAETSEPAASDASAAHEARRQRELLDAAARQQRALREPPAWIAQLILAADQFIVQRQSASGATRVPSHSVIAGYPWFSDWGRDTMIALPGLAVTTGRYDIAASVLRTFGRYVSEGMLPNRFPDLGEAPEYNTVDATLWYFVALDEYVRASGDQTLPRELYPTLKTIVDWHRHGTRFGIHIDDRDRLLRAGEEGVQLTWMDAKIGEWVVTPRIGKPVEINALWFNALCIMRDLAASCDDRIAAREYDVQAHQVHRSFNERFWNADAGYLYDVIDSPQGDDPSLRPNQLIALSLRHPLIEGARAKAIVDVCARELWTPLGMRSLSRTFPGGEPESRYAGRYIGGPRERDAIYHQGTAWSWLLGPFALAHHRVYADANAALGYLDGIEAHLREACIGQVSEISDGDAPFTPRGCFAQAWGVAEILRAWSEIHANER